MRATPVLFPLILLACGGGSKGKGKDSGPDPMLVELVDECTPVISVPGPLGSVGEAPDPHEDTFGAAPTPFSLHLGWPSSDPSQSISWIWRTDADTKATVVEYGTNGQLTERIEGASYLYGGASAGEGPNRVHEAKICEGLEPNTTYTYRVGGEGNWSPEYTFTTPGEPGSFDTYRVAVMGDSRGAYETFGELLTLAEAHSPDFYVFSGDMVDLGPSQAEWDAWFAAGEDIFPEKVVVPSHGNHEFLAVHYFAQFSLPNNEQWFSVRYGDLHLVSLNDTTQAIEDEETHQPAYMRAVFAEHESAWQMTTHHQSLYSTCTTHGSALSLRGMWEPVYDEFGVDAVFAGHNHIYERSVPVRAGAVASAEEGTVYFVTGGAGAPLYTGVEPDWFGDVANPVEHYMIADFGPNGVEFTVRDASDTVIDTYTMARRD